MEEELETNHTGKTVERIVKHEMSAEIYFTDGTWVEFNARGSEEIWLSVYEHD